MTYLLLGRGYTLLRIIENISKKEGLDFLYGSDVDSLTKKKFDIVIVDDSIYSEDFLHKINLNLKFKLIIYMASKDDNLPSGFDAIFHKPFLPDDFIKFMQEMALSTNLLTNQLELDNRDKDISNIKTSILNKYSIAQIKEILGDEQAPSMNKQQQKNSLLASTSNKINSIDKQNKSISSILSIKKIESVYINFSKKNNKKRDIKLLKKYLKKVSNVCVTVKYKKK